MDGTPVTFTTKAAHQRTAGHDHGDERPRAAHGSDKELEPDDPFQMVGVRYPIPDGVDGDRVLARSFVEEYALLGWRPSKVRMLFETPQFAAAHDIRERRGDRMIDDVLAEVFGPAAVPDRPGAADQEEN